MGNRDNSKNLGLRNIINEGVGYLYLMVDDISRQWNRQIKCYLSVPCEQRGVSIGFHIIFFVPIGWHKFIASY